MKANEAQDSVTGIWDDREILDVFHNAVKNHKAARSHPQHDSPSLTKQDQTAQASFGKLVESYRKSSKDKVKEKGRDLEAKGSKKRKLTDKKVSEASTTKTFNQQQYRDGIAAGNSSSTVPLYSELDEMVDSAFNNMLMAWYQSGYHTGQYQALVQMQMKLQHSSHTGKANAPEPGPDNAGR